MIGDDRRLSFAARTFRTRETIGDDVRAVLLPFLISRLLVVAALGAARHLATELSVVPRPVQLGQGLLAWDAAFYADIARGGYDAVERAGLRFFPLVPLLGRLVGILPGVDARAGVLLVANVSAFAFGVLLYRLVELETADDGLARRAVWLGFLLPPAAALVMGYAEATVMALGAACFLALRTRRWWPAAAAGLLAGLARPVGVLLAVPAAWEAASGWRRAGRRERAGRAAAVAAPAAGLLAYLAWVGDRTGDLLLPLRLQNDAELRGGTVEPVGNLVEALGDLLSGDRVGSGLHLVTVIVMVALTLVLGRRGPGSYTVYAAASLSLGVTAGNLDSLERYVLSTFPFVIAAGHLLERPGVERAVLTLSGAGLAVYSILAFTGVLVP